MVPWVYSLKGLGMLVHVTDTVLSMPQVSMGAGRWQEKILGIPPRNKRKIFLRKNASHMRAGVLETPDGTHFYFFPHLRARVQGGGLERKGNEEHARICARAVTKSNRIMH